MQILERIPNLASLRAIVYASPNFHAVYRSSENARERIFTRITVREIHEYRPGATYRIFESLEELWWYYAIRVLTYHPFCYECMARFANRVPTWKEQASDGERFKMPVEQCVTFIRLARLPPVRWGFRHGQSGSKTRLAEQESRPEVGNGRTVPPRLLPCAPRFTSPGSRRWRVYRTR